MNAPIDYRFTYRAQLDRVQRMRKRFDVKHESQDAAQDAQDAQDIMWSFFQNCWHLKDWVREDKVLTTQAQRDAIHTEAHLPGSPLRHCQALCIATKHLGPRPGAKHKRMNINIFAGWGGGGRPNIELIVDLGDGNEMSGHDLADQCIAEWKRIFTEQNLSVEPVPG